MKAELLGKSKIKHLTQIDDRTRKGIKLSVASRNPDGKSEKDLKKLWQQETVPCRQYKPRRRKTLSLSELEEITDAYIRKHLPQKEVARRYRVTE